MENPITFKILLLGDQSVGKTTFLTRYYKDIFDESQLSTVGIVNYTKKLTINKKNINLKVYDTSGQERFRSIAKNFYKGADGILLFYDITSKESFNSIGNWIKSINESINVSKIGSLVIGNKNDLESNREVSEEMKKELEKSQNIEIIETSAKNNINIDKRFNKLIEKMLQLEEELKESNEKPDKKDRIKLEENIIEEKPKETGGCCMKKNKKMKNLNIN